MTDAVSGDNLLRELYELIEEADNSCSEPDDFIRGMRFLFEAAVQRLGSSEVGQVAEAVMPSARTPKLAARPT